VSGKAVAVVPAPGQTGRVFLWTVMPAPGPIGALTVGATADGLALVAFGDHPEAAAQAAERLGVPAQGPTRPPEARLDADRAEPASIPAGVNGATAVLERAVAQLREYFAGERRVFDVPLDWSLTNGSQRRVLGTLFGTVGYGETVTYGELAALAGAPGAARAAGTFCARNRLGLFVPCHRVVGAGGLGSYGSLGLDYKRRLLQLEHAL
jgi:methylated-DNA-[protein]-cysteine S-methyltransferase